MTERWDDDCKSRSVTAVPSAKATTLSSRSKLAALQTNRRGHPAGTADDLRTGANAFAKLPVAVVLDARVGAEALALLAYRVTFAGAFALNRHRLSRVFGIGDTLFDRAIQQLIAAELIDRRRANDGTSKHAKTIERLMMPRVAEGDRFAFIRRGEIERLGLRAAAAYLYLSGRPIGQVAYSREIESRFDWGAPAARKELNTLIDAGFIVRSSRRRGHRLDGFTYEVVASRPGPVPPLVLGEPSSDSFQDGEIQDDALQDECSQDAVGQDAINRDFYGAHTSTEDSPSTENTPLHALQSRLRRDCRGEGERDLEAEAINWLSQYEDMPTERVRNWEAAAADEEKFQECVRTVRDAWLTEEIRLVGASRVSELLLTPEGLRGFRRLVAIVASHQYIDLQEALGYTLNVIDELMRGKKAPVINSWEYLGRTLFSRLY